MHTRTSPHDTRVGSHGHAAVHEAACGEAGARVPAPGPLGCAALSEPALWPLASAGHLGRDPSSAALLGRACPRRTVPALVPPRRPLWPRPGTPDTRPSSPLCPPRCPQGLVCSCPLWPPPLPRHPHPCSSVVCGMLCGCMCRAGAGPVCSSNPLPPGSAPPRQTRCGHLTVSPGLQGEAPRSPPWVGSVEGACVRGCSPSWGVGSTHTLHQTRCRAARLFPPSHQGRLRLADAGLVCPARAAPSGLQAEPSLAVRRAP